MTLQNTYYIIGIVFMAVVLIIGFGIIVALSDIRTRLTNLEKLSKSRNNDRSASVVDQIVDVIAAVAQNKFK